MNKSDTEYMILSILEENPQLTQRQIAEELGLSLGKTNYVIHALIEKGWVKLRNFKRSNNKTAYIYLLTHKGIVEKSILGKNFLMKKSKEYNKLKAEIERLQIDLNE